MISLGFKGLAMPVSLLRFEDKIALQLKSAMRRVQAGAVLPLGAAAGLLAGAAVMLMATGVFTPAATQTDTTQKPASSQLPATSKPAASKSCQASSADPADVFAVCPSFALDFTKQANGSIDTRIFNIYTGAPEANNEAQLYTGSSQNVRIENGSLVLQAHSDPQQGFKYTSARIDTRGKQDFLYGKLVVRAQVPVGIGTWPAIWMLPTSPKYASLSPASDAGRYLNDGELDMMEAVGTEPHVIYGIAHARAYPADGMNRSYFDTIRVANSDTAFHDYELDWTPTSVTFSVDGDAYFSFQKKLGGDYRYWPFDQPFYLVLNLALGGSWGGQDTADFPGDGVDAGMLPASMKIQNISYYPYIGK